MDENGKSAVLDMQGKACTQQTAPASAPGPAWARWRAPLGYPTAALCLWFAHPTFRSIVAGSVIASAGLVIRAMAAGHLRKREALAQSGPYAYTRNPLSRQRVHCRRICLSGSLLDRRRIAGAIFRRFLRASNAQGGVRASRAIWQDLR